DFDCGSSGATTAPSPISVFFRELSLLGVYWKFLKPGSARLRRRQPRKTLATRAILTSPAPAIAASRRDLECVSVETTKSQPFSWLRFRWPIDDQIRRCAPRSPPFWE